MTDYSEGGARLEFGHSTTMPPRFLMTFDGFVGAIACELRHTSGDQVGVQFCPLPRRREAQLRPVSELLDWLAASVVPITGRPPDNGENDGDRQPATG